MEEEPRPAIEQETGETEARPARKKSRFSRWMHDFLGGDYLSQEGVFRNLPYLLFITILAILYIGNTYYAEKTYKEIEQTTTELKELRFQYITTRAALMYNSRQTEVARRAAALGLKETTVPPYKIFYSKHMPGLRPDTNAAGE